VSEFDDAHKVLGTDDLGTISYPFWSPDGRYVAFRASNQLMKIDVEGGAPETITRVFGLFRRGSWASNGEDIIYASDVIMRVPAAGGDPERVTQLDGARREIAHSAPAFLPDGRHFLFKVTTAGERDRTIYIGSLDTGERPVKLFEAARAIYAEPGYLLFARGETLFAQRFDAEHLELSGDAVPIVDDVYYADSIDTSAFDASAGNLIVRSSTSEISVEAAPNKLVVRRSTGETIRLEATQTDNSSARQSASSRAANEASRAKAARDDGYPIVVFADWPALLDRPSTAGPVDLDGH
jgi:Tol biopolymer transport system component